MLPEIIDFNLPLRKTLDRDIRKHYQDHAGYLLHSLKNNKLEVELIEANPKKHQIHQLRGVISRPPPWYSKLYNSLSIMREGSYEALHRIQFDSDKTYDEARHWYLYDSVYRELIHKHLLHGYEAIDGQVPPLMAYINEEIKPDSNLVVQPKQILVAPF